MASERRRDSAGTLSRAWGILDRSEKRVGHPLPVYKDCRDSVGTPLPIGTPAARSRDSHCTGTVYRLVMRQRWGTGA